MAKLLSGTRVYGTATVDTQLIVAGTTASTSTVTGALLVSGGVGIRGDLWVGGIINGTIAGAGSAGTANTSTQILTASTNTTTSHFLTFVDSNNATATAENLVTTSTIQVVPRTGEVDILSTLSSTSTTTGALVVAGGVGVGGNLNVNGSLRLFNNNTSSIRTIAETIDGIGAVTFEGTQGRLLSITDTFTGTIFAVARSDGVPSIEVYDTGTILLNEYGGWVEVLSTAQATSTATGAVRVLGGVGIRGNLWVGGTINGNISGAASTASFISTIATATNATYFLTFVDSNNASSTGENLFTTSTITVNPNTGEVDILSTLASTSTTTGALVVNGGVGIGGGVWVRGIITGTVTTATNIAGGSTGTIFYQSSTGTTAALSIATTAGWQLVSNGVIPVWTASSGATAITINNDTASTTTHFLAFVSTSTGTVSILKTAATTGMVYVPSSGNFGVGTISAPIYKLEVNGSFAATTKSFLINHPTKQGWRLRYGSLEGAENGVYARGRLTGTNIIELPEYWTKLIDPNSITVNITPIGRDQNLFVKEIQGNTIVIGNSNLFNKDIDCYYTVFAERNDVEKLVSEIPPDLNG